MSPAPPVEAERRARSPARVTFEGTRPPYRPPSPYQGPSFEPESTPQGREAVGYSTNRGDYRREQSPGPSEGYQRAPSPYPRNRAIEYSPRESSAGSGYRNQSNGYQSNRGRPFPAGGNVYSAGGSGGNWQPGDRGAENPGGFGRGGYMGPGGFGGGYPRIAGFGNGGRGGFLGQQNIQQQRQTPGDFNPRSSNLTPFGQPGSCFRCGRSHPNRECMAINIQCSGCGRYGHWRVVCRSSRGGRTNQ